MDEEALATVIDKKVPIGPTFTFQANLLDFGEQIGASPELREIFRLEITESAAMLKRAYDAGVPLLSGTESGFSITPYGEWHYRELEVFVKELEMTPLQAIKAATSDNAYAMKMAGEIGAVETGYLADLLLVRGDVSKDVCVLADKSNIEGIYLAGKPVNLPPLPDRRDPPGWRVGHYGNAILTQSVANQR